MSIHFQDIETQSHKAKQLHITQNINTLINAQLSVIPNIYYLYNNTLRYLFI